MRFALFYHSLISDWNHGNAHFLRGVASELVARRHEVCTYEPADAWSVQNLVRDHGEAALAAFRCAYPALENRRYGARLDLDEALEDIDVVIVHEWNEPELVARIGALGARGTRARRRLVLFHDTHHRTVTAPDEMARYDLSGYDGVLGFGRLIAEHYRARGHRAWTWHEAADTRVFKPQPARAREGELVWIGNWGDDERTAELREMLIEPARALGLRARAHGVRYPAAAQIELAGAGIEYAGWLPNFHVPAVYARFGVTVHVPRRAYTTALPGIPTIRPFEALACGIPLVSAPWQDDDHLFTAGQDYLVARDGAEMKRHLRAVLREPAFATELAARGLATIRARHTCAHRVDELFTILEELI